MILTDTGPLVALFDPADHDHGRCAAILSRIEEPLCTTVPVLTEAFHLLAPASIGSQRLMDFVSARGLTVWFLDDRALIRAFELMLKYADHPMDLADASLVVLAETMNLHKVFTIDRGDFGSYRIKRGHRHLPFEILG
ncbi:type II toxin-antitoxin system VapC family toxin [uncultured Thiodictyon sp.]|jgi:predicted nucleic acid-binding protein|uniref:type II toxin-antitoxin system VapC family toxin n=1 Tax=uncultured Thiodictyon sp. TaxID=1846217 RepID=UPI0025EA52E9|nr:PIN domain-containing protein [uncultured Thiodictyon sp.]